MSERENKHASPRGPEIEASELRPGIADVGSFTISQEVALLEPDYKRLRRGVNGRDDALEIIADREARRRLQDVLRDPNCSHDELLEAMFDNFSGAAYGDVAWQKYTGGWSTIPKVDTVYGDFRGQYPQLSQLSLDVGFVTHLDEYMSLANSGQIDTSDFHIVRQQLKEKLGDVTVWRGMSLSDEELENVKKIGIQSSLSRQVRRSDQPLGQFEAMAITTYPNHAVESHFSNSHPASSLISVSVHREIAVAVGRSYGKISPDKKFYLFQIKIPKIDLIDYTDHAIRTPSMIQHFIDRDPNMGVSGEIDGEIFSVKWMDKVEQFGYWKIDPEDIVEITEPQITQSTWNGKTTRTS